MMILVKTSDGWQSLELSASQSLSFTKQNPLFGLDDMECERTQSFDIPDTAHNNAVLELAKVPAFVGAGMRRNFTAQLQDGAVVKNGCLYITEYDGKKYKATFVTGELFGLKAIQEAGSARDIINSDPSVWMWSYLGDGFINWAESEGNGTFGIYKYAREQDLPSVCLPSWGLSILISLCLRVLNEKYVNISSYTNHRIVQDDVERFDYEVGITVTNLIPMNNYQLMSKATVDNAWRSRAILQPTWIQYNRCNFGNNSGTSSSWAYLSKKSGYDYKIGAFACKEKCDITFPDVDELDDYILVVNDVFDIQQSQGSVDWVPLTCYGGRNINQSGTGTGEEGGTLADGAVSLRGQTVSFAKGDKFALIRYKDYVVKEFPITTSYRWNEEAVILQDGGGEYDLTKGYIYTGQPGYSFTLQVEGDKPEVGGNICAFSNIPDVDLIDLLKTLAALEGKTLNYSDEKGVYLDDWTNWLTAYVLDGKIDSVSSIRRTFIDYGRKNTVSFDSDDTVRKGERISRVYEMDNDYADEENELFEIPFSESSKKDMRESVEDAPDVRAYVRNGQSDDGLIDSAMLMDMKGESTINNMYPVTIPEVPGLQAAIAEGTTVELTAVMTLQEFEDVKSKTPLQLGGVRYCWQEMSWEKGKAKITMVKLPTDAQ